MSSVKQSELRDAIDFMKNDSGSGTKARKQDRFRQVYQPEVAHIVAGERYDSAGVGPATARSSVEAVYPQLALDEYNTISEALATVDTDGHESLEMLVDDLDAIAQLSGNDQKAGLQSTLRVHAEPSLVTLALLDDESVGLGTSEMRGAFFDGTRDERKHREAFVETTAEFIRLAQENALPTVPIVGRPFSPMLAVRESRGQPDNAVGQRKIDGYRIVVHIKQEEVGPRAYAFTRKWNDVTASLPELNEMDWPEEREYIIDCEVIAEDGSYNETSSRVGRDADNVDRSVEMHFDVFDCIMYQGDDVSQSPFEDRFNMAMEFVGGVDDDRLNILPICHDIQKAKDDAIAAGAEGIIVKDYQAPYEFGKRSTYWQKVKMDSETVDVIITDFHEGDGEGSGTLGSVSIESVDGVPLGRSGSGFSDGQREDIWNNQDAYINRVIEVEARGLGTGDNLRMPIFLRHRPEGEADPFSRIAELMKEV